MTCTKPLFGHDTNIILKKNNCAIWLMQWTEAELIRNNDKITSIKFLELIIENQLSCVKHSHIQYIHKKEAKGIYYVSVVVKVV